MLPELLPGGPGGGAGGRPGTPAMSGTGYGEGGPCPCPPRPCPSPPGSPLRLPRREIDSATQQARSGRHCRALDVTLPTRTLAGDRARKGQAGEEGGRSRGAGGEGSSGTERERARAGGHLDSPKKQPPARVSGDRNPVPEICVL